MGGLTSVFVGYAGQLLSAITLFPFVTSQLLSGLHVFWLILAAAMVSTRGSAAVTGALKGLIEASLFSHLGLFSFLVSLLEGAVADTVFAFLKRKHEITVYFAGGLSSASNLLIVHLFFFPPLSIPIYVLAYFAAFLSGLPFGGYLTTKVLRVILANLQTTNPIDIQEGVGSSETLVLACPTFKHWFSPEIQSLCKGLWSSPSNSVPKSSV
jgi:ABC-type thiamin/hydroxymethylpyrimidine transport system permease subunit